MRGGIIFLLGAAAPVVIKELQANGYGGEVILPLTFAFAIVAIFLGEYRKEQK